MAVKVREKDGVGVNKDGIAVRVTLIANSTVGTALVKVNGKITEPPHSRFRADGQQVLTQDDLDIPQADYGQMYFMAGGILGKKRKKAQS